MRSYAGTIAPVMMAAAQLIELRRFIRQCSYHKYGFTRLMSNLQKRTTLITRSTVTEPYQHENSNLLSGIEPQAAM
jgi:hypothetical protein